MRIIDLAGVIEPGMWWMGAPLPNVGFKQVGSLDKEGWVSHEIKLSIISGTYLETAAHMIEGARSIDQVKPEELIREALIINVSPKGSYEHISREELEGAGPKIKPGDALLINTGWYHHWKEDKFIPKSPHFEKAAIDFLLEKKISILGSDMVSFDDPRASSMILLRRLFKKDILILSPLVELDEVKKERFKLIVLPLKLKGLSASPCRVIDVEY